MDNENDLTVIGDDAMLGPPTPADGTQLPAPGGTSRDSAGRFTGAVPYITSPEKAREVVNKRWADFRAARDRGLAAAAADLHLTASPEHAIEAIVKAKTLIAVQNTGHVGNDAARVILASVGMIRSTGAATDGPPVDGARVTVDMSADVAQRLLERIAEIKRSE